MRLFAPGQEVVVYHGKPWRQGRPIRLRGRVSAFDRDRLVVSRQFRNPGQLYDGLGGAVQQSGDFGEVLLVRDAWVSLRRYFRAGGTLIGELYNIQSPTIFEPGIARYVDLEVDVAFLPGHTEEVAIQDLDDLRTTVSGGGISQEVADLARRVGEELAARLRAWDSTGEIAWDVRPDPSLITPSVEAGLRRWARAPLPFAS